MSKVFSHVCSFLALLFLANIFLLSCDSNIVKKQGRAIDSIEERSTAILNIDSLIYDPLQQVGVSENIIDEINGFRRLKFGTSLDSLDFNQRGFRHDTVNSHLERVWLDIPIRFIEEYYTTSTLVFDDRKLVIIRIQFNDRSRPRLLNELNVLFGESEVLDKRYIQEFSKEEIREAEKKRKQTYQNDAIKEAEKEIERLGLSNDTTRYFRLIRKDRWEGKRSYYIHYLDNPPSTPKLVRTPIGEGNSLNHGKEYLEIGLIKYENSSTRSIDSFEIELRNISRVRARENEAQERLKQKKELLKQF